MIKCTAIIGQFFNGVISSGLFLLGTFPSRRLGLFQDILLICSCE